MERNTTQKGGFWMMVEELHTEPAKENQGSENAEKEIIDDEFFPDTSF